MHILALVSDQHINSTVALCPPTVQRDDNDTHHASPAQMHLWRGWLAFAERVQAVAEAHGLTQADITAVFNGDLLELDSKRRTSQVITRNPATVLRMAADVIEPLVNISGRAYFTRGTPAHSGKSAWSEEMAAQDCDIARHDGNNASWNRISLQVERVLFDIQHHGRVGGNERTRLNPLGDMAYRLMLQDPRPQVALRAHNHVFYDTGANYPVRLIGSGSWQLSPEYMHRAGVIPQPEIGGWILVVDEQTVTAERVQVKPGRGKVERI